jgi:hypothetical protein
MPRGRGRPAGSKTVKKNANRKAKPKTTRRTKKEVKSKEEKELERKIAKYEHKMIEWWNGSNKTIIQDADEYTKAVFVERLIDGYTNVYEMINQNKQRIGIIHPWKDKKNQYPMCFKDENNNVMPMGVPEYEYMFDDDCPFHDMPKRAYYKYKFCKIFNKFILNDEITTIPKLK